MNTYQTIVVGTDGSDSSFAAVEKAALLAGDAAALLVIVCAHTPAHDLDLELGVASESLDGWDSALIRGPVRPREILQAARDKAVAAAGADQVVLRVVAGAPADALVAVVEEIDADLLVIGSRGLNSLTGRLLGSVPAEVARKSPCDVMVVRTVS